MLNKIVFKSLKKSKFLIFAVSVLFTIATVLMSLSILTFKNLDSSYQDFKQVTNQEDYRFYGISQFDDKYDAGFENGFETQFNSEIEKHNYYSYEEGSTQYVISKYENHSINKIKLTEGKYPLNKNEILISKAYSDSSNLSVGDTVVIDLISYEISGIGYIAEYTLPIDLATGLGSMTSNTLSPIYMNSQSYSEAVKNNNEVLYYSGKFNEIPTDEKETLKNMTKKFYTSTIKLDQNGKPVVDENFNVVTQEIDLITYTLDNDINFPLNGFELEISNQQNMFRVMSIVVITITLFLTIVLFNNIFRSQKREMGILKAEGISFKKLSYRFSFSLFLITLFSSFIGLLIANFLVQPLTNMLLSYYSVPIDFSAGMPHLEAILALLTLNLIICALVYLIAIYRNLKAPVLSLIKNIETEKLPSKRLLKFLDKTSFKTRYRLNIMIRNIKTTLILVFGVFVSSFLLLLGMLLVTSIKDMVQQTYSDMYKYDYSATYSENKKFSETNYSILESKTEVSLTSSDELLKEDATMNLYGFNVEENDLINLTNKKDKPINRDAYKEGIVVSNLLASSLSVSIGDTITFKNPYSDSNITMRVTEISSDGTSYNAYFDLDYLQKQLGVENEFITGEVGVGDKKDSLEQIDSNIKYQDTKTNEQEIWDSVKIVLQVVTIQSSFAVIISFISLVTISSIVISKNKKTISIMKVLGYNDNEINKMTTSVYKWVVIIVYFSCLPLFETMFQTIINSALSESDFAVVINIDIFAALIGFFIIFITYIIASKISKRTIKKISLAQSLKVDE